MAMLSIKGHGRALDPHADGAWPHELTEVLALKASKRYGKGFLRELSY